MEIIPAILTTDPQELKDLIDQAEDSVSRVQIDIVDGVFADNKTVDPSVFDFVETNLLLDFHLMVKQPTSWVEKAFRAGADRIIGHVEMMSDQAEFFEKVQEVGAYVGLALDINTPVSALDRMILNNWDVVLVMGVPAGFGGQEFDKSALPKISKLAKMRKEQDLHFKICTDGGVIISNVNEIIKAGADEVSIGRRIFDGDLAQNLEEFKKAASK